MTTKEKLKELEDRIHWLEVMSGNTRRKAMESNPYDLSQRRDIRKKRR